MGIVRDGSNHSMGVPSGKRLRNCGKSPVSIRKLTISMDMFNSHLLNYERVSPCFACLYETDTHEEILTNMWINAIA